MQESAAALILKLQRSINIVHNPISGWVILGLSLLLTFAAFWITSGQVRTRAHEHFLFRTTEISLRVRQRLMLYEQALHGGRGLFNSSEHVARTEWKNYVASLHLAERLPGIQGLGFAAVVPPDKKTQIIAEVRAEGFPDFDIHPDGERDFYTSILYLEPFNWRNRRAFGFDMWSHPVRREAMAAARDNGEPTTSGVITLVQETNRNVQRGFLIYIPVYESAGIPATLEQRRATLRGWVYAPFRMGDLVDGVLGDADANIVFEVYDGERISEETVLLESNGEFQQLAQSAEPTFRTAVPIDILGRRWTAHFIAPQKVLISNQDADQPLYILIAGILVDLLLFYVIISLNVINRYARRTSATLQQEFTLNQQNLAMQTRLVETMEKETQAFFELAPGTFLVVSQRGLIVKANRYAHEMFRFAVGELVGLRMEDLLPPSAVPGHAALREKFWSSYFANPVAQVVDTARSITFRRNGGEEFPVSINLMPVEIRGEMHVVMAVHDLSQQKQIEQTLADAKEKAESASRAKTEFVANMSHEIRTPLNAVLGAAQLLEKTTPSALQQKYIRMIRASGEALLGVINDILDFSKIEAGRMELAPVSFNLDEVLARVAVMMSVAAGEKDLELVVRIEPRVRRQLTGDPLRLQQVLINLVSNAIKFTDRGEVVVVVELDADLPNSRQGLTFVVRDTGIGMTLPQQTRIFKAFAQADASITRRFGGTGLGLVISNKVVGLMGGRLRVISEPGVGSEFSFSVTMPFDAEALPPGPPAFPDTADASEIGALGVRPRRVLLLDEHRESQLSLQGILDLWDWSLICCKTWSEVVAYLADDNQREALDFALLSCKPLETLEGDIQHYLESLRLPRQCAKVLLLRSQQRALMVMSELQRHFDAVLAKPMLTTNLATTLVEAVTRHRDTESGAERPAQAVRGPLHGVRLLLVEDNVFNQTVARGLLEDMGVDVTIANHGGEAIECMTHPDSGFDIILMDIQMPVMDGLTATRNLRNDGVRVPIIAMTAGVLASERAQYLANGMDDLVPKPIDGGHLQQAISHALAGRPRQNSSSVAASVQVFNAQRLDQLTKGRSDRVVSMVQSLRGITADVPESLNRAWLEIQAGERISAAKTLHRLKGMVANFGGEKLAERIQTLEGALQAGDSLAELRSGLDEVEQHFGVYSEQAGLWIQVQEERFL